MSDLSAISTLHGSFVVSQTEFWSRLESECVDESFFEGQGEAHEDIDLRLVDKLHELLVPILGEPGSADWWHNLDCNGDGVRPISLNRSVLQPGYLEKFQQFLSGEHQPFCILVQVHEDIASDEDTKIGCIAIFSDKAMFTREIVQHLAIAT